MFIWVFFLNIFQAFLFVDSTLSLQMCIEYFLLNRSSLPYSLHLYVQFSSNMIFLLHLFSARISSEVVIFKVTTYRCHTTTRCFWENNNLFTNCAHTNIKKKIYYINTSSWSLSVRLIMKWKKRKTIYCQYKV